MFNACKLLRRDFHASEYWLGFAACPLVLTRPSSETASPSIEVRAIYTKIRTCPNRPLKNPPLTHAATTLDWLLVDQGRINTKASGATSDAGRHRIVRAVAEALSASIGAPITPSNLPRINESLRNGTKFRHMGTAHNLEIYEPVMRAAVEDPINRLIEGLKGLEDRIDLIGVVGGHPAMYAAELQKRFPNVPVFTSPASLYANLRGFQAVAQSTAQRLTQAA